MHPLETYLRDLRDIRSTGAGRWPCCSIPKPASRASRRA